MGTLLGEALILQHLAHTQLEWPFLTRLSWPRCTFRGIHDDDSLVGILMGSKSDWETMKHTVATLKGLGIPCEAHVASAHRTPEKVVDFCQGAEGRGLRVIIAAAGGAAHLAGVCASKTHLPVLGVPIMGWATEGMDALLSTVQMPAGIPVGTLAIGKAGAINAALLAASILALSDDGIRERYLSYRRAQTEQVLSDDDLVMP